MTTAPGADERRIRSLLQGRGVGYAPQPPDAPAPAPMQPAADWWAELYDGTHADHHHAPTPPPRTKDRLPNWRKGETTDLNESPPDAEAETDDEPEGPDEEPADDEPEWVETTDPDDPATRRPGTPRNPRRASARRVQDAYAGLDPRMRFLLYNGGAAATGWALGLEPLLNGWITACHHDTGSVSAALFVGAGMVVAAGLGIDRRSRYWWGPLPWLLRIPLASAILAVLLFAPGAAS